MFLGCYEASLSFLLVGCECSIRKVSSSTRTAYCFGNMQLNCNRAWIKWLISWVVFCTGVWYCYLLGQACHFKYLALTLNLSIIFCTLRWLDMGQVHSWMTYSFFAGNCSISTWECFVNFAKVQSRQQALDHKNWSWASNTYPLNCQKNKWMENKILEAARLELAIHDINSPP